MILLIDNYDSFSYNLYQMIGAIEPNIKVIRNDEMTIKQIEKLRPDRIILSRTSGDMCGIRRNCHICKEAYARQAVGDKVHE